MADIIKKVVLKVADIPQYDDTKYYFRFRLVSDDLNETSLWSQIYEIAKDSTP